MGIVEAVSGTIFTMYASIKVRAWHRKNVQIVAVIII
jgi:hypothetical protein